jgi:hypothetical protein
METDTMKFGEVMTYEFGVTGKSIIDVGIVKVLQTMYQHGYDAAKLELQQLEEDRIIGGEEEQLHIINNDKF